MPNPSRGSNPINAIIHSGVVVVVGANGSGKSRLGTWLENPRSLVNHMGLAPAGNRESYRIGAQRLLQLPGVAQRLDSDQANTILREGTDSVPGPSRVQGDPVVGQTNDFPALVNALFAERNKHANEYYEIGKRSGGTPGMPSEDSLDRLERLWGRIFPQRKLEIGNHQVSARPRNSVAFYPAAQLSDGERVGFYLIGHVLMAPEKARIVIDEPELHLHPSIQTSLWNALEGARTDCTFVYITHDLAFAASRTGAPVVVLFDYTAPSPELTQPPLTAPNEESVSYGYWDWQLAPRSELIPTEAVIKILGTRRPTLFVEGDGRSLDLAVYEALMPDKHVVPAGNCEQVEKATRAFRILTSLHHIDAAGIIDKDDREETQIAKLQRHRIYSLPVAGVENFLALPECIRAYMHSVNIPPEEQDSILSRAQASAKNAMKSIRTKAIADRAQYAIRRRLQAVRRSGNSVNDLARALQDAIGEARPADIYANAERTIDAALLPTTDFTEFLGVFRNKAILTRIAVQLGTSREAYKDAVVALLQRDSTLRSSLRRRLPIPEETPAPAAAVEPEQPKSQAVADDVSS